jgi:hypothetical protein
VYHHADARPDRYQHVDGQVKQTPISAWMRVPVPTLARKEPPLARKEPALALRETA